MYFHPADWWSEVGTPVCCWLSDPVAVLFSLVIDLIGHVEELGGVIGSRLVTVTYFSLHV